ncbi:MAG: sigma-70 family RNA polymerase sigma factor [Lentisphaerae bacterium]|nr:MAG: sigma-70 family RNA polymerase sigma factor [Lentisphaerota bacterium]
MDKAFEILIQHHYRGVFSYIYTYVNDYHAAEDLTQETFLAAYRQLDRFDPSREFGPWVRGIARNKCLNYLNRSPARKLLLSQNIQREIERFYQALEPRSGESWNTRLAQLRECIKALPDALRGIVTDYYYGEHSAKTISQLRAMTERAVWQKMYRARNALRRCLMTKSRQGMEA